MFAINHKTVYALFAAFYFAGAFGWVEVSYIYLAAGYSLLWFSR